MSPRSELRALAALLLGLAGAPGVAAESPLPWGDQGDGTYRNPVLPADYSDPDVIRVGDDFYLVASEFHFMGIQVLAIVLLYLFPGIGMWLPEVLYK